MDTENFVNLDRPYELFENGGIFPLTLPGPPRVGFVIDGKLEAVESIPEALVGVDPSVASKSPIYRIEVVNAFTRRGLYINYNA